MWLKHDFEKYYIWKYYCRHESESENKNLAIKITKHLTNDFYTAQILDSKQEHIARSLLWDNDFEVLKLKCLLVAKDIGWIIDKIT